MIRIINNLLVSLSIPSKQLLDVSLFACRWLGFSPAIVVLASEVLLFLFRAFLGYEWYDFAFIHKSSLLVLDELQFFHSWNVAWVKLAKIVLIAMPDGAIFNHTHLRRVRDRSRARAFFVVAWAWVLVPSLSSLILLVLVLFIVLLYEFFIKIAITS